LLLGPSENFTKERKKRSVRSALLEGKKTLRSRIQGKGGRKKTRYTWKGRK